MQKEKIMRNIRAANNELQEAIQARSLQQIRESLEKGANARELLIYY
jgi:hypothetical protein